MITNSETDDAGFSSTVKRVSNTFQHQGPATQVKRARNITNNTSITNNYLQPNYDTHPIPDTFLFQVDQPETSFTGRSNELHQLNQFFSVAVNAKSIGVVYGIGGLGKTQLAREFIKRNRVLYNNFIWIHSGKVTSIEQSFEKLSKELRLPLKDADGGRMESESVIVRVIETLCKRKTLFVYDKVDNPESTDYVKSILGKALTADNLHVLITSQHQEWPLEFERFPLNVWNKTESIEYITKILKGCGNDTVDDKESLAKTLQYFPLALRQATAYISVQRGRRNSKFKISEFIGKFNRKTREMLRDESFKKQTICVYERTTYTAWQMASNEIKKDEVNGALAMRILNIIAFCGEGLIKREIFYCVGDGKINLIKDEEFEDWKEEVDSAMDLLMIYCMVECAHWSSSYVSIHRLIQKVTKLLLEDSNEVETSLRDALQLLTNLAATKRDGVWLDIEEHIVPIFNSAFSSSVKEILIKDFSSLPVIIVRDTVTALEDYTAIYFSDKILVPMTNILGTGNRHVLKIRYYIALFELNVYWHICGFTLVKLRDIFEKQKVYLSEKDSDTLETLCQILSLYTEQGKFEEAVSWLKHNNCVGDIYEDVISTFEKYKNNRHLTLPLYQNILRVQKSLLGEGHYDTISTLRKIVDAQRGQGNSELSFKCFKELFEVECKHRPNRNKLEILDEFLKKAADCDDCLPNDCSALRMYHFVLTQRRNLHGDSVPGNHETLVLLAREHHILKNYNASARLFESALEIQREVDYDIIEILTQISCAHYHLRNFDTAGEWYQNAVDNVITLAENEDEHFSMFDMMLAEVFRQREDENYDLALRWYNIILKKQMELFGENHPTTVEIMYEIAGTYIDFEVSDKAFDWYQRANNIQSKSLSEGYSYTVTTMFRIASTHGKFKSYDQALDQYRNLLDKLIEIESSMNSVHCRITNIVNFHRNKENYELALGLLEIILEKEKDYLGADDRLTLATLEYKEHMQNLIAERHPANALKLFQVELEKQKESLVASHCDEIIDDPSIDDSSSDNSSIDETVKIQCLIGRTHGYLTSNDAALEMYRNALDKLIERAEFIDEIDWHIIENEVKFLFQNESYNLALALYNIILEEKKKKLGANHYKTLYTSKKIACIQTFLTKSSLNVFEQVELQKQIEYVVEKQLNLGGEWEDEDDDQDETMWKLLRTYSKRQNYDDALFIYRRELKIASQLLEDDTDVWKKFYDEPSYQFDVQNYDLALRFYELLFEKQMFWFGIDYSYTLKTMHEIARIHAKLKRYDQALNSYQVVLDKRKTSLGDFHHDTLETMSQLAHLNIELGNRSDAIQLYRQVYAILKYLKGSEHPDALSAFQLGELEERDVSMDYLPDSLKEEFEYTERPRKLRATK